MTPERLQRRRVRGWRMPEGAVYIGRPTRWGNPYPIGCVVSYRKFGVVEQFEVASPRESVALYRRWVNGDPLVPRSGFNAHKEPPTLDEIRATLSGKDLVCWCPEGQYCHGSVLLDIANDVSDEDRLANDADSRFVDTEDARDRYEETRDE